MRADGIAFFSEPFHMRTGWTAEFETRSATDWASPIICNSHSAPLQQRRAFLAECNILQEFWRAVCYTVCRAMKGGRVMPDESVPSATTGCSA